MRGSALTCSPMIGGSAARSKTRRTRAMIVGRAERRETGYRERVAGHRRHAQHAPVPTDGDRPRIALRRDNLHTRDRAHGQERDQGVPIARRPGLRVTAPPRDAGSSSVPRWRVSPAGGRTTAGRSRWNTSFIAAGAGGHRHLGHGQAGLRGSATWREAHAASAWRLRIGEALQVAAEQPPQLPLAHAQARRQGVHVGVVERAGLDQRQRPRGRRSRRPAAARISGDASPGGTAGRGGIPASGPPPQCRSRRSRSRAWASWPDRSAGSRCPWSSRR